MAFERFIETGRSYKPKISIRGNGQIGFNFGAIKRFVLENYEYAVLFYDKETQRIGIKLTNEKEEGISKLKVRKSSAAVSAKSFLDYYEIEYGGSVRKFDIYWDEAAEMLIADLSS